MTPAISRGCAVLDVASEDGLIRHVLDGDAPEGDAIEAAVWTGDRRFDHMQQHTGQHILSQAFVQRLRAETVAFHLGDKTSTIDLNRSDLDARHWLTRKLRPTRSSMRRLP